MFVALLVLIFTFLYGWKTCVVLFLLEELRVVQLSLVRAGSSSVRIFISTFFVSGINKRFEVLKTKISGFLHVSRSWHDVIVNASSWRIISHRGARALAQSFTPLAVAKEGALITLDVGIRLEFTNGTASRNFLLFLILLSCGLRWLWLLDSSLLLFLKLLFFSLELVRWHKLDELVVEDVEHLRANHLKLVDVLRQVKF